METRKPVRKKRSRADKMGKWRYLEQLEKRIFHKLADLDLKIRVLMDGLGPFLHFEKPIIEKSCCKDQVDCLILEVLYEAGLGGLLPKDIAARLKDYGITRHHVTRRLRRMNKRLQKELAENVAERLGWRWSLTDFAFNIWGEAEIDPLESLEPIKEEKI